MTGNGWDLTLHNDAFASKGVLTLDGNDQYAEFPSGILSNLTEFTIMCWVNIPQFSSMARIWNFGEDEGNFISLAASNGSTGIPVFEARIDYEEVQRIEISQSIQKDKWVHLAVTFNGSKVSIYIDAKLVASGDCSVTPSNFSNATQNWIGRSHNSSDPYLVGGIVDFHIHYRSLLVEQIATFSNG